MEGGCERKRVIKVYRRLFFIGVVDYYEDKLIKKLREKCSEEGGLHFCDLNRREQMTRLYDECVLEKERDYVWKLMEKYYARVSQYGVSSGLVVCAIQLYFDCFMKLTEGEEGVKREVMEYLSYLPCFAKIDFCLRRQPGGAAVAAAAAAAAVTAQ